MDEHSFRNFKLGCLIFYLYNIHSAYWDLEWQKTCMQKLQITLLNANTFFLNWVVGSRILTAQL